MLLDRQQHQLASASQGAVVKAGDGTEPWPGVVPMLANGKFEEMLA